jgi:hypothetical protein
MIQKKVNSIKPAKGKNTSKEVIKSPKMEANKKANKYKNFLDTFKKIKSGNMIIKKEQRK